METKALWNKRMGAFLTEALGYLRYVGNSGAIGFLVLVVLTGAYYYSRLLKQLPDTYPFEWGIGLVMAYLLTRGQVRTFLKEADLVFLLPLEPRMKPYFRSAVLYSFVFQAAGIMGTLLVLWPLYRHRMGESALSFGSILVVLLVLRLLNTAACWQEERIVEAREIALHRFVRACANAAIVLVVFVRGFVLPSLLIAAVFIAAAAWYYRHTMASRTVNWERLLQTEQALSSRFYSWMNQFVDVPYEFSKVRRRDWVALFADRLSFTSRNAYMYLYAKTFVRSELFAMALRLTVIGGVIIMAMDGALAKWITYVLVLGVTAVQLSSLLRYHRYTFWTHIYPLPPVGRREAVERVVGIALLVQSFFLDVALFVPFSAGWHLFAGPVVGLVLAYGYSRIVLRRRLQSL
ncbi:ABC-2 type transport system permease protein [Aneurinibacillus soli]|uniref:Bacterial ABC transporter protein EcsB n=1 Tax=Aneurinibacillus soli TaxID=1500254 RepID=A0A0U5B418_9BACL|nr:ABC transporter permease [Aneurinibacillus soli]PYE60105.1 ABC-2 type transport system permease protein [Aneurinibacillus soli]BAU26406.1 Bacterial ABC transporter protein EcsB [Aneurinibacillus soli]